MFLATKEVVVDHVTLGQGLGVIHTVATVDPDHVLVLEGTEGIHIPDHTHDLGLDLEADHRQYLDDKDRHLS